MGDRGEDMQQRTRAGNLGQTWVTAIRTEPIWYVLYQAYYQGSHENIILKDQKHIHSLKYTHINDMLN